MDKPGLVYDIKLAAGRAVTLSDRLNIISEVLAVLKIMKIISVTSNFVSEELNCPYCRQGSKDD